VVLVCGTHCEQVGCWGFPAVKFPTSQVGRQKTVTGGLPAFPPFKYHPNLGGGGQVLPLPESEAGCLLENVEGEGVTLNG